MMQKRWYNVIIALIVAVAIFSVSAPQAQVLPVFRIGVLDGEEGALTRGAQLAVKEINDSGGVVGADGTLFQLQLVVQSPADMEFAVANLQQASVIAVIGPATSELVLGNQQLLRSLGVPILTTATDDTVVVSDTSSLTMRLRAQESLIGRALADYLVNDLNAATVATVQLDIESTVGVIGFTRAASQLGLSPSAQYLLEEDTSLQEITLNIAAAQTQFVAAYGPPELVAALYTGLRENDWAGRFVYNRANQQAFRDSIQESLLEGVIGASTWSATLADDASQQFVYSYIRAFDDVPQALDAAAYDGIYLLKEAIGSAGNLQTNLLSLNNFEGVQGDLTPTTLAGGEFSNNVVVTTLGEFGAPNVVARFEGTQRVELEDATFGDFTPTPSQPTATPTPEGTYLTVTRAVQNVRVGPSLDYDILGQLQEGDTAEIIGATLDFSWVAINFRGTTGWLSRGILDVVGDTTIIPVLTPPPTPTPLPATATPTPQPFPDIVVTSATPNRLIIGTVFSVTVTVRNQGGVGAGQFAIAASFEPGAIYAAQIVNSLAAGAEITIGLSGTLAGATGLYNVAIIADLNNQVNEGVAGESNNNAFVLSYIADAPLLTTAPATGTITLGETNVVSLDGGTNDIQWGGGAVVPLAATQLVQLTGFASFNTVHRDAIAAAPLISIGVLNITPGMLIGIRTDTEGKYGVLQVISATPGNQITFNYRMYQN
ncbi:MAG: ABC transporter substrate-binding protein [Phototrophicaceae bacterium]